MKISPLLNNIDENTFIQSYLAACGISDVDAYLNPDSIEYQSPGMYKNMDVAVDMFRRDMSRIGIVVD